MRNRAKHAGRIKPPDFIGIGPPRTGTTWLDRILRGHVNLPEGLKETQFFNLRYGCGIEWYLRFFENQRPGVPTGEFSPSYFPSLAARGRISQHLPGCKIVCTLREPVARLYSSYRMWRKLGLIKDPFERIAERHKDLLDYTRYATHVAGWQQACGSSNVLVLIHEEGLRDRQAYLDRFCDFIGARRLDLATVTDLEEAVNGVELAPRHPSLARRARQLRGFLAAKRWLRTRNLLNPLFEFGMGRGDPFPPLEQELEVRLRRRFEPEIKALEELLDRDLSLWRKPSKRVSAAAAEDMTMGLAVKAKPISGTS